MLDYGGCRRLILGILLDATRQARRGDEQALDYLAGPDSRAWADELGIPWPPPLDYP